MIEFLKAASNFRETLAAIDIFSTSIKLYSYYPLIICERSIDLCEKFKQGWEDAELAIEDEYSLTGNLSFDESIRNSDNEPIRNSEEYLSDIESEELAIEDEYSLTGNLSFDESIRNSEEYLSDIEPEASLLSGIEPENFFLYGNTLMRDDSSSQSFDPERCPSKVGSYVGSGLSYDPDDLGFSYRSSSEKSHDPDNLGSACPPSSGQSHDPRRMTVNPNTVHNKVACWLQNQNGGGSLYSTDDNRTLSWEFFAVPRSGSQGPSRSISEGSSSSSKSGRWL